MNKLLMVGTSIVFFALAFYSVGIYTEQKHLVGNCLYYRRSAGSCFQDVIGS